MYRVIAFRLSILLVLLIAITWNGSLGALEPRFKMCETILPTDETIAHLTFVIKGEKHSGYYPPEDAQKLAERAIAYCTKGLFDHALKDANKSIKTWERLPSSERKYLPEAYASRGRIHYQMQRYDQALYDFMQAFKIGGRDSGYQLLSIYAHWKIAERAWKEGRFDKAIEDLTPPIAFYTGRTNLSLYSRGFEDLIELSVKLATIYEGLGDLRKAASLYSSLIDADPSDAESLVARGRLSVAQGNLQDGLRDFDKAVELKFNIAEYRVHRGKLHVLMGNVDAAVGDFGAAIDYEPTAANFYHRAQAYRMSGLFDDAISDLDMAIRLSKGSAVVYRTRGWARLANVDFAGALEDADAAIRLEPKHSSDHILRGLALSATGNVEKAIGSYGQAILLDPSNAEAFVLRAWLLLKAGRVPEARRDALRALALNPGSPHAIIVRARIDAVRQAK